VQVVLGGTKIHFLSIPAPQNQSNSKKEWSVNVGNKSKKAAKKAENDEKTPRFIDRTGPEMEKDKISFWNKKQINGNDKIVG